MGPIRISVRRHGGILVASSALAALCFACGGGPSSPAPPVAPSATIAPPPSASASPSPSPSASSAAASPSATSPSSAAPAVGPCASTDIAAVGGPLSGAAGSVGADVTVTASATCQLPDHAIVVLVDADGRVVLAGRPSGPDGPTIDAGDSRAFSFAFSNWCAEDARTPLTVALSAADGPAIVQDLAIPDDDLPPCNGPGQPPSLSTSEWRAS